MLSLGKLAPGQQRYYLDTVARGAEEYYTGAKEAPGERVGRSAARLRLAGEVDAEVLRMVFESRDPTTAQRLTRTQGAPTIPGFDATFCAPKSVSLLFALGQHVGEGFASAGFRHRTSRAADTHLHTHVLVANLVWCPDDERWSALDGRSLYGWAKTVGYLYEAQLRAELSRRLGVTWTRAVSASPGGAEVGPDASSQTVPRTSRSKIWRATTPGK